MATATAKTEPTPAEKMELVEFIRAEAWNRLENGMPAADVLRALMNDLHGIVYNY